MHERSFKEEAYILFRKGVKIFLWLCLEKETPNFMKSHFSLEGEKNDWKKLSPIFHQHGGEQIMQF